MPPTSVATRAAAAATASRSISLALRTSTSVASSAVAASHPAPSAIAPAGVIRLCVRIAPAGSPWALASSAAAPIPAAAPTLSAPAHSHPDSAVTNRTQ